MIPASFEYVAPTSIADALLHLEGLNSHVFTGDQSFVSNLKKGSSVPGNTISLKNIEGLNTVTHANEKLEIGIGVSFKTLLANESIHSEKLLIDSLSLIKDAHLLNHSNVGGALYHSKAVHATFLAALLALETDVNIIGKQGNRQITLEKLLSDGINVALAKGEIVKSIELPANTGTKGQLEYINYQKTSQTILGIAISFTNDNNTIQNLRIAASGFVQVPLRLASAELALIGKSINQGVIDQELNLLDWSKVSTMNPIISNTSYLVHLMKVLIRRAVLKS